MPRIWRAIGDVSRPGHVSNPMEFIDGNLNTFYEGRDFQGSGGLGGIWGEFYTLDMGMQIPADHFKLVPPEGNDPFFQEPYRPNYKFEAYELTATNDKVAVESQLPPQFRSGVAGTQETDYYLPLDQLLAKVDQNFDAGYCDRLSAPISALLPHAGASRRPHPSSRATRWPSWKCTAAVSSPGRAGCRR